MNKTEITNSVLRMYGEALQTDGAVDTEAVRRLLAIYRELFSVDTVYVLECLPDGSGYSFACSSSAAGVRDIEGVVTKLSPEQAAGMPLSYDADGISTAVPLPVFGQYPKACIRYGIIRDGKLDGSVGMADFAKERTWTTEERNCILKLGRMLRSCLLASRLTKMVALYQNESRENEARLSVLQSLASIYLTVHVIDMVEDTCREYKGYRFIEPYTGTGIPASVQLRESLLHNSLEDQHEAILEFADLSTLDFRMKGAKTIAMDFKGLHVGWTRAQFIAMKYKEGHLSEVAFTTQIVDPERRHIRQLEQESSTDSLTGFFNRRAFEQEKIDSAGLFEDEGFVYATFDLNDLKSVNDTIGHAAGDEMLQGVAKCMEQCFGEKGRLFRTGGDEFVALIYVAEQELEALRARFDAAVAAWKGTYLRKLSVSAGYASRHEFPGLNLSQLARISEDRMYRAKNDYYRLSGAERRVLPQIYASVCSTYLVIIRINLQEDSYRIISSDSMEESSSRNYDGQYSVAIHRYGVEFVHPDDLEAYDRGTDMEMLRAHFTSSGQALPIFYRRLARGTWRRTMLEIVRDEFSTDGSVYLYTKDIQGAEEPEKADLPKA